MVMKSPVSFFYLGPPKSASTWIFHCLKDHPAICPTRSDETYFFDMHYNRGFGWYDAQFEDKNGLRIECTPTSIYNQTALERIVAHNGAAKFALGLRHPVDRAFSAYWHVRKKGAITVPFTDLLEDYTWFRAFLETSFVADGLEFLQNRAGTGNIHLVPFDGIQRDAAGTYAALLRFIGIDDTHKPDMLTKKINVAGPKQDVVSRALYRVTRAALGERADRSQNPLVRKLSGKADYLDGIDPAFRARLVHVCEPEIEKLERLTGLDLLSWRQ